jgi:hypothetical protein
MGMLTETQILNQLKKGQGETNAHLEALRVEQQRTNQWLAHIAALLEQIHGSGKMPVSQSPHVRPF